MLRLRRLTGRRKQPSSARTPSERRRASEEAGRFLRGRLETLPTSGNRYFDLLRYGPREPEIDPYLGGALTVRRRVWVGPREREALASLAADTGWPVSALLDHYVRLVRHQVRRLFILTGLDDDLAEPELAREEDELVAEGLSLVLDADRTTGRRRWREVPLEGAPTLEPAAEDDATDRDGLAPAVARKLYERWAEEEQARTDRTELAAQLRRVRAAATPVMRRQMTRVLAVLRARPELTYCEAVLAAGYTRDQGENLAKRLRRRLA